MIGVASNGIHSNGLSLARKVVPKPSWDKLLEPTAIYVKAAVSALNKYHRDICGIANITGGGWRNMLRLNEKVGFHIDHPLPVPKIFQMIGESVDTEEMYKTFNMGLGLAIIAKANDDAIVSEFASKGHFAQVIGTVTGKSGEIEIDGFKFTLKSK